MRNTQYKTWILAKNLKNVENETQNCMTWNTTRNNEKTQKKEKCSLQELEYSKKTEKEEKCEKYLVGPGIWREKLKNEKHTL